MKQLNDEAAWIDRYLDERENGLLQNLSSHSTRWKAIPQIPVSTKTETVDATLSIVFSSHKHVVLCLKHADTQAGVSPINTISRSRAKSRRSSRSNGNTSVRLLPGRMW